MKFNNWFQQLLGIHKGRSRQVVARNLRSATALGHSTMRQLATMLDDARNPLH